MASKTATTRKCRTAQNAPGRSFSIADPVDAQDEDSRELTLNRTEVLDFLHGPVGARATVDLPHIINEEHAACLAAVNNALDHALCCGELLLEAKRECRHGEWQKWLADNFVGSDRTARAYMRIARHHDVIDAKRQTAAELTLERALHHIAPRHQKPATQPSPEGVQAQKPDWIAELLDYDETVAADLLGSTEAETYEAVCAAADGDPPSFERDEQDAESWARGPWFDVLVDSVRFKGDEVQRASSDDKPSEAEICAARAALRALEIALTEIGALEDVEPELITIRTRIERALLNESKNR